MTALSAQALPVQKAPFLWQLVPGGHGAAPSTSQRRAQIPPWMQTSSPAQAALVLLHGRDEQPIPARINASPATTATHKRLILRIVEALGRPNYDRSHGHYGRDGYHRRDDADHRRDDGERTAGETLFPAGCIDTGDAETHFPAVATNENGGDVQMASG